MIYLFITISIIVYFFLSNYISYKILKKRILNSQKWDLNICCGKTDGKGINADIVKHSELPNFIQINDIYNLPFKNKTFNTVLSSHTIEHVDDPESFIKELKRVGEDVTIVLPPLWDITAAFNIIEHKWIFITLKKEHKTLPLYLKLPFSTSVQNFFGQRMHA